MLIRYRTFPFTVGLQTFTQTKKPSFNDDMKRATEIIRINISGYLQVPNTVADAAQAANLVTQIASFENAFSRDEGDFSVAFPTGEILLNLRSADFTGGLRVVDGPNYEGTEPGELVRRRSFSVALEGERVVDLAPGVGGGNVSVSFYESLAFEGTGGPRFVILETMEGPPVRQQVNERTICRCVQEGRAVQRYGEPTIPRPLFAGEREDLRRVVKGNPGKDLYDATWSYTFESTVPLSGRPTRQ